MNSIPLEEMLSAYVDDELTTEERQRLEDMLPTRPDLQQRLREYQRIRRSLALLADVPMSEEMSLNISQKLAESLQSLPAPHENITSQSGSTSPTTSSELGGDFVVHSKPSAYGKTENTNTGTQTSDQNVPPISVPERTGESSRKNRGANGSSRRLIQRILAPLLTVACGIAIAVFLIDHPATVDSRVSNRFEAQSELAPASKAAVPSPRDASRMTDSATDSAPVVTMMRMSAGGAVEPRAKSLDVLPMGDSAGGDAVASISRHLTEMWSNSSSANDDVIVLTIVIDEAVLPGAVRGKVSNEATNHVLAAFDRQHIGTVDFESKPAGLSTDKQDAASDLESKPKENTSPLDGVDQVMFVMGDGDAIVHALDDLANQAQLSTDSDERQLVEIASTEIRTFQAKLDQELSPLFDEVQSRLSEPAGGRKEGRNLAMRGASSIKKTAPKEENPFMGVATVLPTRLAMAIQWNETANAAPVIEGGKDRIPFGADMRDESPDVAGDETIRRLADRPAPPDLPEPTDGADSNLSADSPSHLQLGKKSSNTIDPSPKPAVENAPPGPPEPAFPQPAPSRSVDRNTAPPQPAPGRAMSPPSKVERGSSRTTNDPNQAKRKKKRSNSVVGDLAEEESAEEAMEDGEQRKGSVAPPKGIFGGGGGGMAVGVPRADELSMKGDSRFGVRRVLIRLVPRSSQEKERPSEATNSSGDTKE